MDAEFSQGLGHKKLRLSAQTLRGVHILAALLQDAIFDVGDIRYDAEFRRVTFLLRRLYRELYISSHIPKNIDEQSGQPIERADTLLLVNDVNSVKSCHLDFTEKGKVLNLLTIATSEESGEKVNLRLIFSGNCEIDIECEIINLYAYDVSLPYSARTKHLPDHKN